MNDDGEFDRAMERVEQLIAKLEREAPRATLEPARELLAAVLGVHKRALETLLEIVRATAADRAGECLRALAANPSVSALLLLHDLHPDGELAGDAPAAGAAGSNGGLIPIDRLHAGRGGARA